MKGTEKFNWLALIGISLASFLGLLDLTIVNTALPAIQSEFSSAVDQLQWVINILLLALTATMVILGKLADLYGRRLCLYIGFALFAVASLGAGFATSINMLIFFRFLQGIAIALLYTAPLGIIPNTFPAHQQGKAMGILVGLSSFGLALGPAIGGMIVSSLGWRWIFFINPPIVLLCFLFCWKTLQESKSSITEKMDWWGFLLLLVSIPMFILAVVKSQTLGFLSPLVLGLLIAAIIGIVALYHIEKSNKAPIIQFSLMTRRVFLIGLVANFTLAAFYAIDFFIIPLYLHYIRGQSASEIGFTLLPATLLIALLSPIAGRIVDKQGPKGALIFGLIFLGVSAVVQAQFNAQTPLYWVVGAYVLFGIGWASILSPSLTAAIASVPSESSGVAAGTVGTFHNFGGAIGLAFGTLIFAIAAKFNLLYSLQNLHIANTSWVQAATANMDQALHLIMSNTNLTSVGATTLFEHFFLHGYACVMWSLVVLALAALSFVILSFRKTMVPR